MGKASRKVRSVGIGAKLSVILIGSITIVFCIYIGMNYVSTKTRLNTHLNDMVETMTARLTNSLVNPLWNLDIDQASQIIRAEMMEKQIYAMIIRQADTEKILTGFKRDEEWKPVETNEGIEDADARTVADIQKDEQLLGTLEIILSRKFVAEEIRNSLVTMALTVVAMNLIVALTLFLALRRMLIRPISHVVRGLKEAAGQVASGSGQISVASHSLAEGASEQAASVEETSSSLEELSSMTRQNADNAREADSLMKDANQIIAKANESMDSLTLSMAEISTTSEKTQKIIKTIDEIAFQTNLLALNAAVEAARAGEAGAGFAVVADEVRNLAMRAAEAAKDTAHLIEGSVKQTQKGSELVGVTNKAFGEVAKSASKVGELVGEIAAASSEQARGIDQIAKAIGEMDKVVQHNAASAEESASASEEMNAQATQVEHMVNVLVSTIGTADSSKRAVHSERTSAIVSPPSPHESVTVPCHGPISGNHVLLSPRPGVVRSGEVIPPEGEEFQDF